VAVYTHLSAEDLEALIGEYDVGELVSAKGIAEGVSNSNGLVETTAGRFILTMYEHRVDADDLPFFLGLLDHLSSKGSPVPRTIHDRAGAAYRLIDGKAVALIEFLPGVSIDTPRPTQARAVGEALAGIHVAAADFPRERANTMGLAAWRKLLGDCGERLVEIDAGLPELVARELDFLEANWPRDLPRCVIHADLFPDNVLMLGNRVSGLIDFYFVCTDIMAYDLAVTHAAWCFAADGSFRPTVCEALIAGYHARRPLPPEAWAVLPVLARGAAMRFLASRAYDWLHTPADALVTRKDPMVFARRLAFYETQGESVFRQPDA
jgi:homoserine kinase type II